MSIESEVAALTAATTDLLNAVNVSKATLDAAVDDAQTASATAVNSAGQITFVTSLYHGAL